MGIKKGYMKLKKGPDQFGAATIHVLTFLASRVGRNTTLRDICTRFGWENRNAAFYHIADLARRGLIKRNGHKLTGYTVACTIESLE